MSSVLPQTSSPARRETLAETEHRVQLKARRARISEEKRKLGLKLVQSLLFIQDNLDFISRDELRLKYLTLIETYPAYSRHLRPLLLRNTLSSAIKNIRKEAKRTHKSDRDRIFHAIEMGCYVISEMMAETGLSHWDVRIFLRELIRLQLVEAQTERRAGSGRGRPRKLYVFRHTSSDRKFFS